MPARLRKKRANNQLYRQRTHPNIDNGCNTNNRQPNGNNKDNQHPYKRPPPARVPLTTQFISLRNNGAARPHYHTKSPYHLQEMFFVAANILELCRDFDVGCEPSKMTSKAKVSAIFGDLAPILSAQIDDVFTDLGSLTCFIQSRGRYHFEIINDVQNILTGDGHKSDADAKPNPVFDAVVKLVTSCSQDFAVFEAIPDTSDSYNDFWGLFFAQAVSLSSKAVPPVTAAGQRMTEHAFKTQANKLSVGKLREEAVSLSIGAADLIGSMQKEQLVGLVMSYRVKDPQPLPVHLKPEPVILLVWSAAAGPA